MENNKDIAKRILSIQQTIEDAKAKKSHIEGQEASLMEILKERFDCSSVEKLLAEKILMKKELAENELKLNEKMSKLENDYAWH